MLLKGKAGLQQFAAGSSWVLNQKGELEAKLVKVLGEKLATIDNWTDLFLISLHVYFIFKDIEEGQRNSFIIYLLFAMLRGDIRALAGERRKQAPRQGKC